MAVLSKIRQRSFFLIVIIALALFSFVLTDVIKSGGFGGGSNDVGSVNGQEIAAQSFMQKVSVAEKQGQGTSTTQAMNSAWEQEVRKIILTEEFDKLGLKIGSEQLINVIKQNPNLAQNPQFFDENSPTQRVGGGITKNFETTKHKYRMYSLDNSYSREDLLDWENSRTKNKIE